MTSTNSLAFVTAIVVGWSGCASTKLTSMVEPTSRGAVYQRVLVIADVADLALRQEAELAMQRPPVTPRDTVICDPVCREATGNTRTVFLPAHTVLFPGRDYSPDDLAAILREHSIDATLVLSTTAAGTTTSFIPPTYHTSCSTWNAVTSCSTSSSGGAVLESPWATFSARLYDASTAKVVWIATAKTTGDVFSSNATLIRSMARETLVTLARDGVVR